MLQEAHSRDFRTVSRTTVLFGFGNATMDVATALGVLKIIGPIMGSKPMVSSGGGSCGRQPYGP
jgi:hypothetical protein